MVEDGRPITENEYLESRIGSFSKNVSEKNKKVRDSLVKFFRRRELMTFVRPVEEEKDLGRLESVKPS